MDLEGGSVVNFLVFWLVEEGRSELLELRRGDLALRRRKIWQ